MMWKEVAALIGKEIRIELRQKYAIGGILLYVVSTVFVCYLSFKRIIDVPTWNALLWIILLFTSVNATAKSFVQENRGQRLYLYTLCSGRSMILSKIIYNAMLLLIISLTCILFYFLLIGNPVQSPLMFMVAIALGSIGFSSTLTLIAGIASQTGNNSGMIAILSFPIMLPMLLTLIRFSKNAIDGIAWSVNYQYVLVLILINVIVATLSYLLFPYLWRD